MPSLLYFAGWKAAAAGAGVCGWRAGEERGAEAETQTEEDSGRPEEEAAN